MESIHTYLQKYQQNSKELNKERYKEKNFQEDSCINSLMWYGTWTTTKKEKSGIQAQETTFLRKVKGGAKLDRLRNIDTRKKLNISDINGKKKEKSRWKEHVERMHKKRITLNFRFYQCHGRDLSEARSRIFCYFAS